MAQIARIQKSSLNLSARIDAEHYSPRFAPILQRLVELRTIKLRWFLVEPVKTGHTPSTKNDAYYSSNTVKFIKTDNLREDRIDTFNAHFLSDLGNSKIAASELMPNDVIVTIIGATEEIIGRAARIYEDLGRANINQNVALIRSRLPAGYLTVFLNSHYGREQLIWLSRQTGQVNLNCREVEEISIPLFSDEFTSVIQNLNDQRHNALFSSRQIYSQAEQLLLAELDLQDWQPQHRLTFVRRSSEASQVRRVDAEHFQPKYADLRERIQSYPNGFCRITDIATNSAETVEPRNQPNQPFKYIELANINQVTGTIESVNEILGKEAPSRARMFLRSGDVISSSVKGSVDKVARVPDEYHGAIGSTGFFVLRPRAVESGYLLALVKSIIVREQMECEASGTILAAVPGKSLRNIIVPDIPERKRNEITLLVEQSHAARRETQALLEKAKRAVEIAIEEGEEKAIAFIQ